MKEKKNVILIVVDQMRYDCMGINGNNIISTPNLNYLASEGYNFSNAYSAIPSCLPARASLITGLKAENHGRVELSFNTGDSICRKRILYKVRRENACISCKKTVRFSSYRFA